MVYLSSDYHLMWTRVTDLPKGSENSRFGGVTTQFDPASEQLSSEPRNRSTTTPLVIDRHCTVDHAKKAKSLPVNREHTQEHNQTAQKTAIQRPDRFWTLTCFDDYYWLRTDFDVGPLGLASLSNKLSIHIWIIKNGVRTRPGWPVQGILVLDSEVDSSLIWASTLVTRTR
jgi:hypothetical protein